MHYRKTGESSLTHNKKIPWWKICGDNRVRIFNRPFDAPSAVWTRTTVSYVSTFFFPKVDRSSDHWNATLHNIYPTYIEKNKNQHIKDMPPLPPFWFWRRLRFTWRVMCHQKYQWHYKVVYRPPVWLSPVYCERIFRCNFLSHTHTLDGSLYSYDIKHLACLWIDTHYGGRLEEWRGWRCARIDNRHTNLSRPLRLLSILLDSASLGLQSWNRSDSIKAVVIGGGTHTRVSPSILL